MRNTEMPLKDTATWYAEAIVKKNTVTVLALFTGFLGFHHFYLNKPFKGTFQLIIGILIACTIILPLIDNVIEAMHFSSKTLEEFAEEYC